MVLTLLQARGKLEERDLLRVALGSFCRRSFSDQAPADSDGKAAASSLRQSLRTDRNECLRLLRGRAALA